MLEYGAVIKDLVDKHIKLYFVKVCDIQMELSYNSFMQCFIHLPHAVL